jgi:hypothetical protein
MNTTPDESLLALWLDDELHGEELARMDAWALTQPEQLAAREELRSFRRMMSAAIPAEVEPPYPDFFNSRIEKAIREQAAVQPVESAVPAASKASFWRSWFLPATAFAGMALAFWVGTKSHTVPRTGDSIVKSDAGNSASPVFYTPEQGVDAEWVRGSRNSASVIVLQGVSAIPDSLDFTETVLYQNPNGQSSTAGNQPIQPVKSAQ